MIKLFRTKTYEPAVLTKKLSDNIATVIQLAVHINQANQSAAARASSIDAGTIANSSDNARVTAALGSCAKYLDYAKNVLVRPVDCTSSASQHEGPSPEYVRQLIDEFTNRNKYPNFLFNLIHALELVGFESKKEIASIFGAMVRPDKDAGSSAIQPRPNQVVNYIADDPRILKQLIDNYNSQKNDVALNSGAILRDCIKNQSLARIVLDTHYQRFFDYANLASFDILSDAFSTFRDLMTKHKSMVKKFLEQNYEVFFKEYNEKLIKSENYVTKRQSIKLISEVLLDRLNFTVMTRYVAEVENLKVIMTLLCDRSDAIKFEAFHVFKIFVANPTKTKPVEKLLLKNQAKLMVYLKDFTVDQRQEDEQFQDERNYLIQQIRDLHKNAKYSSANTSSVNTPTANANVSETGEPSQNGNAAGSPVDRVPE